MPEKSEKDKPNSCVLHVYARLSALRKTLKVVDPKLARTSDRVLASIGYPARILAHELAVASPVLSGNFAQLAAAISDYRTFWRVVNTPATIEWALDLLLANTNKDPVLRYADYTQAIAGVAYQILEDLAYLAGKGILNISRKRQADLWVISCLFWAVHVAVELAKLGYFHLKGLPVNKRTLLINLAWAPLTLHWSTYTGLFNEGWVGLFGTFAVWPDLAYKWNL